ncbi:hypothetical protein AXE80_08915 [Wenyingzhuangia fucanilytica]|uniref:Uncharacterized protein n=1 Tax=Wenyingzhuangia fucanilytica TaxID=1790137 RepID=A0A1B1Y6H8_9FLAO|nr:FGGY family carbohydrate kinase [Wenyingzhuangia fucanilytica]ANW96391.1 hypothetical protein AXE80_08915 [Wenyingzhuangia fucanilytica]
MKSVIAVIDIGKTNKKILLFDETFEMVSSHSTRFDEVLDEDGYPCDNIVAIENWIKEEIRLVQTQGLYKLKAINFSTHGASLIYLNKEGKRIAPLYNYLKPLELEEFNFLFESYGGKEEFSRKTASPAYGMLNTGIQMLWLKKHKPEIWNNVDAIMHYPQYLSYLFTNTVTADFTSVGAHTATWDFDNMRYHSWVKDYGINLPEPSNGTDAILTEINNETVAVGSGLHDSSSSIIPLLQKTTDKEFVLLSTGTWIIAMNPFSKEKLTQNQLTNNCLCFMTPEKQQIKSSMQFLGRLHEVYLEPLAKHFNTDVDTHLELGLDSKYCAKLIKKDKRVFLSEGIDQDFEAKPELLEKFKTYKKAYYQLTYEISKKVAAGIDLILDKDNGLKEVYISGGFNKNEMFVEFLSLLRKDVEFKISNCKSESALGAAMLMKDYL